MKIIINLILILLSLNVFANTEETLTVIPSDDTFVTSHRRYKNFGNDKILDLKSYYTSSRILINFDFNDVKSKIGDSELISARFEITPSTHYVSRNGNALSLHLLKNTWTESGASWKCADKNCNTSWLFWSWYNPLRIPYAYEENSFASSHIDKGQINAVSFDLTSVIEEVLSGSDKLKNGFALKKDSKFDNGPLKFYSKESDFSPKLILKIKKKVNTPLVAKLNASQSEGVAPLSVLFDANGSRSLNNLKITELELDFGDGSEVKKLDIKNPQVNHTYTEEGDFQAVLKIKNSQGEEAIASVQVLSQGTKLNHKYKNYGIWITPRSDLKIDHKNGDTASIDGSICKVFKTADKGKKHCHYLNRNATSIRAYFPDMTSEVSGLVNIKNVNERRDFVYTTPKISSNDLNTFTIIVGDIDQRILHLGRIKAKIERRVRIINSIIAHYESKGIGVRFLKHLKFYRDRLEYIVTKIDKKFANHSSVLAQYNLPLQVDNKVSAPKYYSSLVGGFRIEHIQPIGNLFEGDSAEFKTRITNLNDSYYHRYYHKRYAIKYLLDGEKVNTSYRESWLKGEVESFSYRPSQGVNSDKDYIYDVSVSQQFKYWERKLASSSIKLNTLEDSVAPKWKSIQDSVEYVKVLPSQKLEVIDDLGRIDIESFNAKYTFNDQTVDVTSKFENSTSTRGTEYKFLGDVSSISEEGKYVFEYVIADNAKQSSTPMPLKFEYFLDKTSPVISTTSSNNQLTNNPNFSFEVSVVDNSPVTTKVFHNGVEHSTYTESSITVPVVLSEGVNHFKVVTVDAAGNISDVLELRDIVLDTIAPELADIKPVNNSFLRSLKYNIGGKSNEPLSKVEIDSKVISSFNSGNSVFDIAQMEQGEGKYSKTITAYDLAGNSTSVVVDFEIILKLIRINLVSLKPKNGQIFVIGQPGAGRPGIDIDIDGGFFNDSTVKVLDDGSFSSALKYSSVFTLSAEDSELQKSESYKLNFIADTTFSGIVKDVNEQPIPGVTVIIHSNGQKAVTDDNGVFTIAKPITGDQTVRIDGRTVSSDYTKDEKLYSFLNINVSLSNLERNVLERVIYLAPTYLDGSETLVKDDEDVVVRSKHAPGVELKIPAGKAIFPASIPSKINILEIPADKTSIELLEHAKPTKVYAFEPSGVKFSEPVEVTLPNDNNFPVGMELVILSKNSESGYWEPDGVATVVDQDRIITKDGQGISHFSEIYATPYGVRIDEYAPEHKPGIYNDKGGVTFTENLPTYKVMGKDVGLSLNYNSLWANPNVFVTNSFNTPTHHVYKDFKKSGGGFGTKVKVDGYVEVWQKPDSLKSKFSSGGIHTDWLHFDVTKPPKKSTVSYNVDFSSVKTGSYPAIATYVLQYRYIKIQRIRIRKERTFGGTFTKYINDDVNELMDAIFPPPLQTNLLVQNKKNSEIGSGWKINAAEKIHNLDSPKVVVEESSGQLTPYVIKSSVENVYYDQSGLDYFTRNSDGDLVVFKGNRDVGSINLEGDYFHSGVLPPQDITIGVNQYHKAQNYYYYTRILPYQPPRTSYVRDGRARYFCRFQKFKGESRVIPTGAIMDGSHLFVVDSNHRFIKYANFSELIKAGKSRSQIVRDTSVKRYDNTPGGTCPTGYQFKDPNQYCNEYSYRGCVSSLYKYERCESTHHDWDISVACEIDVPGAVQRGTVPTNGYQEGALQNAHFNTPQSMLKSGDYIYIADRGNSLIRKINTVTQQTSVYAGNRQNYDTLSGNISSSSFFHPNAIIQDDFGNFYVSSERGYIRKIDSSGNITHIAGSPTGYFGPSADSLNTFLNNPHGMKIDSKRGYLYVADTGNNRVVQFDLLRGKSKTVVGTNECQPNDVQPGKSGLSVSVCSPRYIDLDENGNLLYLDARNKMIRKLVLDHSEEGLQRYESINDNDHSYLLRLSDGSFERHFRSGSKNIFNVQGQQIENIDLLNNKVKFEYDGDLLTQIEDAKGGLTSIRYTGGKVSEIEDPAGRKTTFSYDGSFLHQIIFPDKSRKTFFYNNKGMVTSKVEKNGSTMKYEYNGSDLLSKMTNPDGNSVSYVHGLEKTALDETNSETDKKEISGEEEQKNEDVITDAKGHETILTKDWTGMVTEITDAKDRKTIIERNLKGQPTKITRFDGGYTEFEYNSFGELTYKYDSDSDTSERFEYNDLGSLLKHTNVKGKVSLNEYDLDSNLLLKQTNANGISVTREYYGDGLIKSTTDGEGNSTSIEYDTHGNVIKKTSPQGESVTYERNTAGSITLKVNSKGIKTSYTYDLFNRLTSVSTGITNEDPLGKMTTYEYTTSGQLAKIVDPNGNETKFEYDVNDRLSKKTTMLGQVTQLEYDANGNVDKEIDPNGNIKRFEYDSDNQLIKKILPDNTYDIVYDDHGNMLNISDSDSAFEFEYIKKGKEYYVSKVKSSGANLPMTQLVYDYDKLGNRTKMSTPWGDFDYTYDDINRLTQIDNHKSEIFSFNYDNSNRFKSIIRPGSKTNLSFDKNGFITKIEHKKSNNSLIGFLDYERDLIGNRTKITTGRGVSSFTYDAESQLKTVSNTELADTSSATETFNYDDLGNRLNDQLGNYTYDQKSQRLMSDYRNIYTYDNNGNLTSIQEKGLTGSFRNLNYSSENQLVGIDIYKNNILEKSITYFYDALGRRIEKRIIDKKDTSKSYERKFIYDGQDILAELDESDSVLGVYTHSTLRTDDVLAVDVKDKKLAKSVKSYFYLKDALGSVKEIVDGTGKLVQQYAYSSFGKIVKILDKDGNDILTNVLVNTSYGFTNREFDAESGMMYYRARFYIPEIGRFIQEDPVPGVGRKPITIINKYLYVSNNPVNNVDPTGKFFISGLIISALIGGITADNNGGNFLEGALVGAGAFTAGFIVGPAIATAMSLEGGAALAVSMFSGGIAGGVVGGAFHKQLGLSSFGEGFGVGFGLGVSGGAAGYYDKFSDFNPAKSCSLNNAAKLAYTPIYWRFQVVPLDNLGPGASEPSDLKPYIDRIPDPSYPDTKEGLEQFLEDSEFENAVRKGQAC